ncbi:hypothetical protein IFO69_14700 [Echinicola sp. CAU 1574]|uniref:Uncharacterized protein n=1 Tax=Echinicola arenosa TaxID=2774144 RepID=A0ABR9AMH8_9BACT|nr:hypothetical protein [Echinicola arenosa]MBD8490004.1 hypothetical protein [Echinicola arenosa]
MKRISLLPALLMIVFSISCSEEIKEAMIIEDEPVIWQELDSVYVFDKKIILAAHETDDRFFTLGQNFIGIKNYAWNGEFLGDLIYYGYQFALPEEQLFKSTLNIDYRYPINDEIAVTQIVESPDKIMVHSLLDTKHVGFILGSLVIDGEMIDDDFDRFEYQFRTGGDFVGLNGRHILLPYRKKSNSSDVYYALVEVMPEGRDVNLVGKYNFGSPIGMNYYPFLTQETIEDGFLVASYHELWKVTKDGKAEVKLSTQMNDIYGLDNIMYDPKSRMILAVSIYSGKKFISDDMGETWREMTYENDDVLFLMNNLNIIDFEHQLYALYNSQIFQLDINMESVKITELDNSGLFGNKITDLTSYYGDSLIMATTLSGAFVKPRAEFFKLRDRGEDDQVAVVSEKGLIH